MADLYGLVTGYDFKMGRHVSSDTMFQFFKFILKACLAKRFHILILIYVQDSFQEKDFFFSLVSHYNNNVCLKA